MEVTTKELRIQPGKIIDQVVNGQEITITYRGKALAKIVPFSNSNQKDRDDDVSIFGMWKDHNDVQTVEASVRQMRKGREF
jgi:prevent-host-death family protein